MYKKRELCKRNYTMYELNHILECFIFLILIKKNIKLCETNKLNIGSVSLQWRRLTMRRSANNGKYDW